MHYIVNDLERTKFGSFGEDWKTGDNALFNLLNAYSMYDIEIGYVQGMNFIAAFII